MVLLFNSFDWVLNVPNQESPDKILEYYQRNWCVYSCIPDLFTYELKPSSGVYKVLKMDKTEGSSNNKVPVKERHDT